MCTDLTSDNLPLSRTKLSEFSAISEIANHGKTHIDKYVVSLDGRVVFETPGCRRAMEVSDFGAIRAHASPPETPPKTRCPPLTSSLGVFVRLLRSRELVARGPSAAMRPGPTKQALAV
jgi:hypothetical protein